MSDGIFKAFIGGLPYDALASDVEQILEFADFTAEQIKNIEIHLVHDRESGKFKGFGYVTFPNEEEVETFISKVDNVEFAKRTLKVNRAQQRNDRGGRGGGRGGFGGDRGDRGGRGGGFRRGGDRGDHRGGHRGGDRFNDGGHRGGFGGGNNRRHRKESEEFGGSQHEDGGNRPARQSEDGEGSSAPAAPAERPRLNLKPRTTDSSEIEARKKQEEEETKKRQEKLFG